MDTNFSKLLKFIEEHCNPRMQWFNTHSDIDRRLQETIFEAEDIRLIYCSYYCYYEILGLSKDQEEIVVKLLNKMASQ